MCFSYPVSTVINPVSCAGQTSYVVCGGLFDNQKSISPKDGSSENENIEMNV